MATDELIIVGSRYGDLADILEPYYEKAQPIAPEEIKTLLGSDVVYLQPVSNSEDPYAVGVFINTKKRLGFVWKDQSPSLCEQMSANNKRFFKARINRINTRYGLMMADAKLPDRLSDKVCRVIDIDEDWAKNIPETLTSITEQSLSLGFAMLCDELPEMKQWNDTLANRLKNLKQDLPADLSGQHIRDSRELYDKMKKSVIKEVRESCDDMLDAYVSRGSKKKMKLWVNKWLPEFFREFEESGLLGLFEAANYTLERVEALLDQAPAQLFYLYKFNRERFAFHLYYAALPKKVYNRLLTLLAVREAMLGKDQKVAKGSVVSVEKKVLNKELLARAIENCQQYFWGSASYAVVFCVCRDDYKMTPNMSAFERKVESLPYKKKRDYICKKGTITNAFSDNYIYHSHIDKWKEEGADERQIKLRDELRKELAKD